jgi:hypothetical protein
MLFALPELVIHPLIAPPYHLWTGEELDPDETGRLLDTAPEWRVLVAALLHTLWLRSATSTVASWKRTGIFDTDSAAYLPLCDRFITADRAQLVTLEVANAFNPRRTKVELFHGPEVPTPALTFRSPFFVDPCAAGDPSTRHLAFGRVRGIPGRLGLLVNRREATFSRPNVPERLP